jgi:hypothetical protein
LPPPPTDLHLDMSDPMARKQPAATGGQ